MKITKEQFEIAYKSAGAWFVVENIKEIEENIDKLSHATFKRDYIKKLFDNGNGPDSKLSGTSTRINCLIRIVKGGYTEEALRKAATSKVLPKNIILSAKEQLNIRVNNNPTEFNEKQTKKRKWLFFINRKSKYIDISCPNCGEKIHSKK